MTVETPAERVAEFTAGVDAACVVTAHTHMQYDRQRRGDQAAQSGQRRPAVRARARDAPTGRCSARTSSSAGRPYDLDAAVERLRAGGMPNFEQIEELMRDAAAAGRGDRARRAGRLRRLTRRLAACRRPSPRSGRSRRERCFVLFAVEDYPDYRPGAYFWVELPDRGHDDEKGLRRHISLVTSPTESGVVGLATRLRDTAFKRTLAELEVGDEVQVEEPKGSFLLPEDTSVEYVFVAGGIGITVFRSMLRFIADEALPYRVTLVYSNRDRESAAFLDELEELESGSTGCA